MSQAARFIIRPAAPEDLELIYQADLLPQASPARRESIQKAVFAGQCLAAFRDFVLGFTILEYTFYGYGFVSLLVVHPKCRRQGVGLALLRHLETICASGKLFTSTNESNLPMQALLEKLGYKPSGIIYGLDEGDPELVFRKDLRK